MEKPSPEEVEQALQRALDEVSTQIRAMPKSELLGGEELEWSLDGPGTWWVFVWAERREKTSHHISLAITATAHSRLSARARAQKSQDLTVPMA